MARRIIIIASVVIVLILILVIAIRIYTTSSNKKQEQFMSACLQPEFQNNPATCNQAWIIAGQKGISTWGEWLVYWNQNPNG